MLSQMGFQEMVEGLSSNRYEILNSVDEEKVARPRRRWAKKMNGRLKGFCLSRSRRLNWKAFSVVVWPKRIAGFYADIVNRLLKIDGACPGIIFSCQWGLPVLSHPNAKCRRNALPVFRKKADIIFTRKMI